MIGEDESFVAINSFSITILLVTSSQFNGSVPFSQTVYENSYDPLGVPGVTTIEPSGSTVTGISSGVVFVMVTFPFSPGTTGSPLIVSLVVTFPTVPPSVPGIGLDILT